MYYGLPPRTPLHKMGITARTQTYTSVSVRVHTVQDVGCAMQTPPVSPVLVSSRVSFQVLNSRCMLFDVVALSHAIAHH